MTKKIKLSDIKVEFGNGHEPKDKHLMELLGKGYKGEIDCYWAIIDADGIQPFSDFKPNTPESFVDHVQKYIDGGGVPSIYVYPKGNKFIMSDDYNLYYLYLSAGQKHIPCYVLGEPKGKYVISKKGPVKLPPVEVEATD